jgi:hypothetical protein
LRFRWCINRRAPSTADVESHGLVGFGEDAYPVVLCGLAEHMSRKSRLRGTRAHHRRGTCQVEDLPGARSAARSPAAHPWGHGSPGKSGEVGSLRGSSHASHDARPGYLLMSRAACMFPPRPERRSAVRPRGRSQDGLQTRKPRCRAPGTSLVDLALRPIRAGQPHARGWQNGRCNESPC